MQPLKLNLSPTEMSPPVELVDAAIERMESLDGDLNALTYRWFDTAREMAGSPTLPDGPFKGVPFLLKDLHAHMEGMPMSNGSAALKEANYHSTIDTTIVSRFKAAGLVICGRTNSPEMGTVPVTEPVAWGPTHNPWNTDHTRQADRQEEHRPRSRRAWC